MLQRLKLSVLLCLVCAAALSCSKPNAVVAKHVVLISLDTTRADFLGCYDDSRAFTPFLDNFAKTCVVFEHAIAPAPTTLASHTSIMTGVHPHTHGVPRNGFVAAPELETLAETLHANGFQTAAFLGSFALASPFGLNQGFDVYDERFDTRLGDHGVDQNQRSAKSVTDSAIRWLDETRPEHAFLFVHYFDAHAPYAPTPDTDCDIGGDIRLDELSKLASAQQRRFVDNGPGWEGALTTGLSRELIERADGTPLDGDERASNAYGGEIRIVDQAIETLVLALRQRGMLDDTLIVVTADHGETFWEHADFFNHGLAVYETTTHVPLLIRGPGVKPGRISATCSTVDLAPTILDVLELPGSPRHEGVSLIGALHGGAFPTRPVFSEATQPVGPRFEVPPWMNARKARCIVSDSMKLVRYPYLDFEQLFDLAVDPGERNDLLRGDTSAVASRLAELRAQLDAFDASAKPPPPRFARDAANEVKRRLAELGYAEGGSDK